MDVIRLLLVEDQTIVRQGLRRLLDTEATLSVVGEAESVAEAVALAGQLSPDVILMDLKLRSGSGLEATRRILADNPDAKILALTVYDDFPMVEEAVAAGVLGYAPKLVTLEELCRAIVTVRSGERYIHPSLMSTLVDGIRQHAHERTVTRFHLTEAGHQLLSILAEGLSYPEVATRMQVSERTVRRHVQALLDHLDVTSVTQAVALAIRQGWL